MSRRPVGGSLRFEPRLIAVEATGLVEEFVVEATLPGGRRIRTRWAEVLDYDANLVSSLRLYFDPLDFLEAEGVAGRLAAPARPPLRPPRTPAVRSARLRARPRAADLVATPAAGE